jgi:hypothetical protein
MRLLITGSRTWDHASSITHVIQAALKTASGLGEILTVVHGGAYGADAIAGSSTRRGFRDGWPIREEAHRAEWERYGKRAGMIRNQAMVNLGADLAAAFIRDHSRGATHCLRLIEAAGIPVVVVRWEDRDNPFAGAASSFPAATERTQP